MSDASRGRVGFVGLGNMGWPMARNLAAAGFELVVADLDGERCGRFATEHSATCAREPAAFEGVDRVVTMLPDDRAVTHAMLEWSGGIAAALPRGAVVIDMSSSNPGGTRELARSLAERGIEVVDAPVSGGTRGADAGTLSIMFGADDERAIERALPILEVLGERLFPTGPLGSGHAMKALNNFLGATAYAATAEALAIGREFGLQPETIIGVVNTSTGRSFTSENVFTDHVLTSRYGTGFALGLLAKDAAIAASLAEASQVEAPICGLVSQRWAQALEGLGGPADHSEAHKQWWNVSMAAGDADAASG
jgi:3-hydroxyisobutyrate dehydrogenase